MNNRLPGIVLLFAATVFIQCTSGKVKNKEIVLSNASDVVLKDKPVSISRDSLKKIPEGIVYPLILSAAGDTIAAQLDDVNGDGKWDELFFVVDLPAKASQTFSLDWVKLQPSFKLRTSVRFGKRMSAQETVKPATAETLYAADMPKKMGFQRYQTDGPSWENDKVGFRHYLDGRHAHDVFGKKVKYMSPETVGINAAGAVEDNYHVMEVWGRDILAVGNSVGIGGVALLKGDSILRLGATAADTVSNIEQTGFHIITEGPVRSMLAFDYTNWKPQSRPYQLHEVTSIWPGMYAYHNSVQVAGLEGDEQWLIGMVSINATKAPELIKLNDQWVALVSHEKHTYNKEWWLGLALILPAAEYAGYIEAPKTGQLSTSFLAKLKAGTKPLNYYSIACWEISDERFKDPVYFRQYVQELGKQISAEVKIEIN
jgi:hypothetical protein